MRSLAKASTDARLMALISCPDCGGDLALSVRCNADGEELYCSSCGRTFPIVEGIPYLLPASIAAKEENTGSHFTRQFTAFESDIRAVDPLQDFYFYSRTGLDPNVYKTFPGLLYPEDLRVGVYEPDQSHLQGRVVLDGGCGQGRFTRVAANAAAFVVGLDLG
jgi:uncharacterized protein YbaR (Trm112 family)